MPRIVDSDDEDETPERNGNARVASISTVASDKEDGEGPRLKRARFSRTEKGKGRARIQDDEEDEAARENPSEDEAADDDDVDVEGGLENRKAGGKSKLSWEEEYARSWDALTEDVHGSLEGAVAAFLTSSKRRRILRDTTAIQRGIIRHLFLILDLSESMLDRDMRPSRLELTLKYAQEFVTEFFDQNPISQLGIIVTRDGMAERISQLGGNPVEHIKALQNKKKLLASGEPSLQNSLNMARSGLAHLPTHGSREVVIVFGSLTTCDPGNIHDTIQGLSKDRIRVSIIGLAAELSLCREIAKQTKGTFSVCLNEDHFKDLLFEAILPPASVKAQQPGRALNSADLMVMGFPTLLTNSQFPTLCSCHSKLYKSRGYVCPRCDSKLCEVPTECGICRLTIVSSPHLARSYRHLFPIGNWQEVNGGDVINMPTICYGCSVTFPPIGEPTGPPPTAREAERASGQPALQHTGRYSCPKCRNHFCIDCDIYVHQLGACPGCHV